MAKIKNYTKHILIGAVSGFLNGLFGSGGGCVVVPAMELILKMDAKKSHATAIAVILVMSTVSSFFYIRNGYFDFGLWLPVTIGGIFGGLTGEQANSIENAIRTGLIGEILSVDGENGEKVTISLV